MFGVKARCGKESAVVGGFYGLETVSIQMAARSAQEINIAELAKLTRLQRVTVEPCLDILIRLSMFTKLGSWTSGESKREIKNPKYHFVDSGIACALRRFNKDSFSIGNNLQALSGPLESFSFERSVKRPLIIVGGGVLRCA